MPDYEEVEPEGDETGGKDEAIPGIAQGIGTRGRRQRKRPVTMCELCVDKPAIKGSYKRHLQLHHLPWYYLPNVACWKHKESYGQLGNLMTNHRDSVQCGEGNFRDYQLSLWVGYMTGVLFFLAQVFGCEDPGQLLHLVKRRKWHPSRGVGLEVPLVTCRLWRELDKVMGYSSPVLYRVDPPTTIACLLHYTIISQMLVHAGREVARVVKAMEEYVMANGKKATRIPRITDSDCILADSHCHLIATLGTHHCQTLGELKRKHERLLEGAGTVPIIICNVVHKNCWRGWKEFSRLRGVYFTFGIHPSLAGEQGLLDEHQLTGMAQEKYCRGIGECGYDTTRCSNGNKEQVLLNQDEIFRMQLRVAKEMDLPIVLHIRGRDEEEQAELTARARRELKGIVARLHKIHVHCFMGPVSAYYEWQQAFPLVKFGFTSKNEQYDVRKVARVMRPQQVLLESDAPYLVPSHLCYARVRNSPFFIESNLTGLCLAFNLPRSILGPITYQNCCEMYEV